MVHVIVGTGFPDEVQEMVPFLFSESITVELVPASVFGDTLIEKISHHITSYLQAM